MDNRTYLHGGFVIGVADICSAFDEKTIGSKVLDNQSFMELVAEGIEQFDWMSCRQEGQALITLLKSACNCVSGGVGQRTQDPDDYVIRVHRGEVGMYLNRKRNITYDMDNVFSISLAAPVDNIAVVVYTKHAYDIDPDITLEEIERTKGLTHIVVAVLASSGQPSTLTPGRFVKNLAGGNLETLKWTADEIRTKAKEIRDYCSNWCVVAD